MSARSDGRQQGQEQEQQRQRQRLEGRAAQPVRFVDERLGAAKGLRYLMDYIFPDHWSFLLGEIALYSFIVLVITGIYLALFFSPNFDINEIYHGSYAPLYGQEVSAAYKSVLNISFKVSGGLLMRQTHHWAADVFVAAITLHLLRILTTGAFRKPRELNYLVGVTLLVVALVEAFAGYMLPDDLMSGMGLVIAYGVALSLPLIGGAFSTALWGGRYPGSTVIVSRLFIAHVFIFPLMIATLIGVHLVMIMRQHHTQFPGPGRRERNVVGTPMWPGYALRSTGFFLATAAVLVLLGGLVQINPIWLWGQYHTYIGTNGAQPDWYLGWLIGGLRMVPSVDVIVAGHDLIPNPFWGGVAFPGLIFALLYLMPWLDRRLISKEGSKHELLDRPRDNPTRTGLVVAGLTWVVWVFVAGSADRMFYQFTFPYEGSIWFFRAGFFVVPFIAFFLTRAICRQLQARESHPLRGWGGRVTRRNAAGGFEVLGARRAVELRPEEVGTGRFDPVRSDTDAADAGR